MPRLTSITSQQLSGIISDLRFEILNTRSIVNPTNTTAKFGISVDISGNNAIVGAYQEDTDGDGNTNLQSDRAGKAYIYNVTTGNLIWTLDGPAPLANDEFGYRVAISGDIAVVGAPQPSASPEIDRPGQVHIYSVSTGSFVRTIDPPNVSERLFGAGVAVSGNNVMIGCATNTGDAVYIYNASTGSLRHTLTNPNSEQPDSFGGSRVAISGSYAVVGSRRDDPSNQDDIDSGKAYIFNVTTGNLIRTLSNPNVYGTPDNDNFGGAVAVSDTYVAVSAFGEDTFSANENSGAVYVFDAPTGNLLHTFTNPNAFGEAENDSFGTIAMQDNYLIVGATGEDETGSVSSGKAYVFDLVNGNLVQTIDNPNAVSDTGSDEFGNSIAIDGDNFIIAAQNERSAFTLDQGTGAVYVFNFTGDRLTPAPGTGDWLDDNGDVVQVDSLVGPSALQVEGVFAVNPTTPFTIRGIASAATGVVTNISANTGTLLEIETDAAPEFNTGERLEII